MSEPEADAEAETAQDAPEDAASSSPEPQAEGEGEGVQADAATPKKKKKKKKPSSSEEREASAPAPLPGAGTPEGEKLREANVAFESGNYARVRELGQELERAQDPAVVDAARSLVRRVSVDPVQLAFLGACAIALMVITWIYILEPHSH